MSKIIRTLSRLIILTSFKEAYLFISNVIGLIFHPYKTIALLIKKRDYSQIALIIAVPLSLWFWGTISILGLRYILGYPSTQLGRPAVFSIGSLTLGLIAFLIYLTFWFQQYQKSKNSINQN